MNRIRHIRRRHRERLECQYTTQWVAAQRDRGAVLPLVLVMIIVGALIVIPVTAYTTSVLRANRVEQEKTRNAETAKGAIRVALHSPSLVFGDDDRADDSCPDNVADLIPDGVMTETGVSVTCSHVDELSADEVFGLEVPVGLAQLQIAPDPAGLDRFSGAVATSGAAPPYPDTGALHSWAWWLDHDAGTSENPKRVAPLPELPTFTGVIRDPDPHSMPGFDCNVFLPGHYDQPVVIDGSHSSSNYYFASGVYYFDEPISISGSVDVVVGQGLADFGVTNDCADDIQVGAHVQVPFGTTYGIDGNSGGATWVLGDDARISVTENGGSPSVRFNQRYAENQSGAWTNIISVNGDWSYGDGDSTNDDDFEDADGDHAVTNVNYVPRSQVVSGETVVDLYLSGTPYVPSHPSLTDEARVPDAPANVVGVAAIREVTGPDDGAVIVSFEGVEGANTNGAIIDDYEVGIATSAGGTPTTECSVATNSVWPTFEGTDGTTPWGDPSGENAASPDGYSCMITALAENATYWVTARAHSEVGWSDWAPRAEVAIGPGAPAATPPGSATGITIETYDTTDALISWDPAIDTAHAPVQAYEVTVYRVGDVRIDSVSPGTGPESGGTSVTLTGSGFQSAPVSDVTFDGLSATSFTVDSDSQITAVTPAHTPGSVDVVVDFGASVSGAATFDYQAETPPQPGWPIITGLSPANGPAAGGDTVTITGTDLDGVTSVSFGGSVATVLTNTSTAVEVTTPAGTGVVPVSVTNAVGTSTPTSYTYDPAPAVPPSISGVGPSSGPQAGGNTVTLTGLALGETSLVTFGGVPATDLVIVSDTEITVTAPEHPSGDVIVDVVVTTPVDSSVPVGYTYDPVPIPAPVITTISPDTGTTAGSTTVILTGEHFTDATSVTFDGAVAPYIAVDSDSQITVTTPSHAAGAVSVVVETPGGTSNAGSFTYSANVPTPPPVACSDIAPNSICNDPGFQACESPIIVRTGPRGNRRYSWSCDAPACYNGEIQARFGGEWRCAPACASNEKPVGSWDFDFDTWQWFVDWGCQSLSCSGGRTAVWAYGRKWCYRPGGFAATDRPAGLSSFAEHLIEQTPAPIATVEEELGSCTASPLMGGVGYEDKEWMAQTQCVIENLPPLGTGEEYRVKVTAINAVATTDASVTVSSITGPGTLDEPTDRVWFPYYEQSIIDIDASGAGSTTVEIPGYISVPMGRLTIDNPSGDPISFTGGAVAGRIAINDSRASLPMGYVPSVIMQRTVDLTATSGNITSTARVKINSDTSYGILRWVTQ